MLARATAFQRSSLINWAALSASAGSPAAAGRPDLHTRAIIARQRDGGRGEENCADRALIRGPATVG